MRKLLLSSTALTVALAAVPVLAQTTTANPSTQTGVMQPATPAATTTAPATCTDASILTSAPPVPTTGVTFDGDFVNFTSSPNSTGGQFQTQFYYPARTLSGNDEAECYTDPSTGNSGVGASNGVLMLTAKPASNPCGLPYVSGMVTTFGRFSQLYGYFQMTATIPTAQGTWPAFWLMPASGQYEGEIDAMEHVNNAATYQFTLHGATVTGGNGQSISIQGGWGSPHTFGVDWEPSGITAYVDGVKGATAAPMTGDDVPHYIIVNLAIGGPGSWPGPADGSTSQMQITDVRAYATAATVNPVYATGAGTPNGCNATANSSAALIIPASTPVTDGSGNTWTVTANGTVTENGTAAAYTADVAQLVTVNGTTYQQANVGPNAQPVWWGWDGAGWVQVSDDPTKGAVSVIAAADAQGKNYAVSPSSATLTNNQLSAPVNLASQTSTLSAAEIAALTGGTTQVAATQVGAMDPVTTTTPAPTTAAPDTTPAEAQAIADIAANTAAVQTQVQTMTAASAPQDATNAATLEQASALLQQVLTTLQGKTPNQ